jgi:hypothetical protein
MLFAELKAEYILLYPGQAPQCGECNSRSERLCKSCGFPFCAAYTNARTTISTVCTQISSFKAGEGLTLVASAISASPCGAGDAGYMY